MSSYGARRSECGFTLIEVIVVIVILSILAVLGGRFVVESTTAYQSTQTRARLMNMSRQAQERISRQLHGAMPYSLRLTNADMCLEFMPIAGGGNYTGQLPDLVNGVAASASISVAPHSVDFGSAQYVSIGAMGAAELYGANPESRASLSARTSNLLSLSAAKIWQRNSVRQRFYLLGSPQAFCIVANQLRFYDNQSAASASVDLSSAYSVLAENLGGASVFALTAGSENRNTMVTLDLTFSANAESMAFKKLVMIRNVP